VQDDKPGSEQAGKVLRERAETLVHSSATDISAMTTQDVQKLIHELEVHQVELELQNERMLETQLELASSRDRFSDLYDYAPAGYLTLDSKGVIIEANLTAGNMLGVVRDSLPGMKFSDFVVSTSQDTAYLYWQKVFASAEKQFVELEVQGPESALVTVRLESLAFASSSPTVQCRVVMVDISDLAQSRQALLDLNEDLEHRVDAQVEEIQLMANAIANLSEGILITIDHDDWLGSRVIFANQAMCQLTDHSLAQVRGRTAASLFDGLIDSAQLARVAEGLSEHGVFEGELDYRPRDGERGTIEISVSPLYDFNRERLHFVAVLRDVSERKRYELAILDHRERLQAIQDAALDAIVTIDGDGVIQYCNVAIEQIFGYTSAEVLGRNVSMLMPEPHRTLHDSYIRRYQETRNPRIIGSGRELVGRHRDGHHIPIILSVSEVDHLGLYTGVIHDISELNKLQREVLLAAGEVQWRIGQSLHDGPQQSLAGLSLVARGLALDLAREGSTSVGLARRLTEGLNEVNSAVRQLGRGLIPVPVGSRGLMQALENLASQISSEYDIKCDFLCPAAIEIEDHFAEDQLYHIAREAVLNAANHSGADRIGICLDRQADSISLRVVDNGSGLGDAESGGHGLGLHIMPYRAATIGGTLTFSGADGGGTVVECSLANTGVPLGK
jgi:PAS domain S-box-containing protein